MRFSPWRTPRNYRRPIDSKLLGQYYRLFTYQFAERKRGSGAVNYRSLRLAARSSDDRSDRAGDLATEATSR